MVDKIIAEDQANNSAVNITAHLLGQEPKKQAAPGTTGGSTEGQHPPPPAKKDGKGGGGGGPKKDGGENGDKGKGKDKGGKKGKGKGKDNDGGKSGGTPKANDGSAKKPVDPNRSCITNFFAKCKHGAVPAPGTKCDYGCHRKAPTDADRAHYLFKKMEAQHGTARGSSCWCHENDAGRLASRRCSHLTVRRRRPW